MTNVNCDSTIRLCGVVALITQQILHRTCVLSNNAICNAGKLENAKHMPRYSKLSEDCMLFQRLARRDFSLHDSVLMAKQYPELLMGFSSSKGWCMDQALNKVVEVKCGIQHQTHLSLRRVDMTGSSCASGPAGVFTRACKNEDRCSWTESQVTEVWLSWAIHEMLARLDATAAGIIRSQCCIPLYW
jgi:hypothetical protein